VLQSFPSTPFSTQARKKIRQGEGKRTQGKIRVGGRGGNTREGEVRTKKKREGLREVVPK
jgi:hypothetical protein